MKTSKDATTESHVENNISFTVDQIQTEDECLYGSFVKIARKIAREDFRIFSRFLDLPEDKILQIEKNCKSNQNHDTKLIYGALNEWKKERGKEATLTELIHILNEIGKENVVSEIFEDIQTEMQQKQREQFQNTEQNGWPAFLSLQEIFNEITIKCDGKQKVENGRRIEKEELFVRLEFMNAPRLLLLENHQNPEGSILLQRLLADWSNDVKYISDYFDLVFVVSIKDKNIKHISSELLQQCKDIIGTDEEKLQAILAMKRRVLLILEGLDETSKEIGKKFLPLLNGFEYPKMTVAVISSADGLFLESECEDLLEIGSGNLESSMIWSREIYFR